MNSTAPAKYLMLIVALLLAVGAYWQGLAGPMVLDDFHNLGAYFRPEGLGISELVDRLFSTSGRLGRSVSMLTFSVSYAVCGSDLWCWKLGNLLIHLVCGVVIYLLIDKLVQASGFNGKYGWLPLLVASVWLLHPLQVSTVLYLVQRMAQLSALFILLGIYAYSNIRLRQIQSNSGSLLQFWPIPVLLVMASLSKENGILLLPLILLVEVVIFRFAGTAETRKSLFLFLSAVVLLPMLAGIFFLILNFEDFVLRGYSSREFDLSERLLTQARVMAIYIWQTVFPALGNMLFFYDNMVPSESILKPFSTLLSLLFLALLLWMAWAKRKSNSLITFGILLFFIGQSVESTIFPLELAFEHRNYLPLLGLIIVVAAILHDAVASVSLKAFISIVIILAMASLTVARAEQWSSKTSFYNSIYKNNPDSLRVRAALAEELTRQERYDEAMRLLPERSSSGAVLQKLYIGCMKDKEMETDKLDSIGIETSKIGDSYMLTGIIGIANLGLDGKCSFNKYKFIEFLEKISGFEFRKPMNRSRIAIYEAHYYWALNDTDDAFESIERTHIMNPEDPIPLFLAAEWSFELGKRNMALEYFDKAKIIARNKPEYSSLINDISIKLNPGPDNIGSKDKP